jgi:hypothetical protein
MKSPNSATANTASTSPLKSANLPSSQTSPSQTAENTSMAIVPLKAQDKEWLEGLIQESDAIDHAFARDDKLVYIYTATDWGEKFAATKRELPAGAVQTGLGLLISAYMDIARLYQVDYGNEPESTRAEIIKRWQLEGVSKKEMPSKIYLKARTVKLHLSDLLQRSPIMQ